MGEQRLLSKNREIVAEVQKNAYIVGGRTLRNTHRLQGYSQFVTENPEFQVEDSRKSSTKKSNSLADEGREFAESLSDSDSVGGADKGDDEIVAYMKQIEQERARALKKNAENEVRGKKRKHDAANKKSDGAKRHVKENGSGSSHTALSSTFTKIKTEKVSADNSIDASDRADVGARNEMAHDVQSTTASTSNGKEKTKTASSAPRVKIEKHTSWQPLPCLDDE